METSDNLILGSFSLPPGCRFYPSDEQLVSFYLHSKNNDDLSSGFDVITEIDVYKHDPFDLPETACYRFGSGGRRRHWYFYTRVSKESRRRRKAGSGYWKSTGKRRDVMGGGAGKVVVGFRKGFVFYLGTTPERAVKTGWVMYEYAPIDHVKTSFVVCRVFDKSHGGSSIYGRIVSCCGEESVGARHQIGVLTYPTQLVNELENQNTDAAAAAVDVSGFQHPSNRQLADERVLSTVITDGDAMSRAILEEDFIELDDLLCPLFDI